MSVTWIQRRETGVTELEESVSSAAKLASERKSPPDRFEVEAVAGMNVQSGDPLSFGALLQHELDQAVCHASSTENRRPQRQVMQRQGSRLVELHSQHSAESATNRSRKGWLAWQ